MLCAQEKSVDVVLSREYKPAVITPEISQHMMRTRQSAGVRLNYSTNIYQNNKLILQSSKEEGEECADIIRKIAGVGILVKEPSSRNDTTTHVLTNSMRNLPKVDAPTNEGDEGNVTAQLRKQEDVGCAGLLLSNLDQSDMVALKSSLEFIEKNKYPHEHLIVEDETIPMTNPIDVNTKQLKVTGTELFDILHLPQSHVETTSSENGGLKSTVILEYQVDSYDVIEPGADYFTKRMQDGLTESDNTNAILDIVLNHEQNFAQDVEAHAHDKDYPRHSLEEIIEIKLADLEQSYVRAIGQPKTKNEILNSLDDPELDASLEDELVGDEIILASLPFDTSACVDRRFSPQPNVFESPTEEPGRDDISNNDENDSTWNMTGNNSSNNNQGEETQEGATGDESLLNTTDQLEIPAVVGKISDENLFAQPSKSKTKHSFCLYCKKMQSVISRHLETVHKDKSPVKKFSVLPRGNPERKKMIETLRLKGNYLFNTDKVYNNTGELLVSRRPNEQRSAMLYKTCHNCKGVFSFKTIRRHRQSCLGASTKGARSNVILSRRIEGRLHDIANIRLTKVMAVLREDDIVRLVRYDELLIQFGNCLCEKYYKQQQEEMIRNRLRTLGRLLMIMKEIDSDITDFKSIYHPKLYKIMLEAVRNLSGFDPLTGVHQTPSLVTSIGTYIKAVGDLLKLHWVENIDEEKEKIVDKYLFLHAMQYSQVVNRTAREDQSAKHRQQVKPLPTTNDIKKLSHYLNNKMICAYTTLKKQYSYQIWLSLLQYTLISVQTFNRRRAGEIERALIVDLKAIERISEKEHPEIYEKLSSTQKTVAEKYARFIITGKLGRDVPVLLNPQMETSLNLILAHRNSTKVPTKNPYIFGIPGFTDGRFKYLRACQLMRQFSDECGAEHPERLRGTYLRKHVATTCAEENMDENKITDIANFMGHAEAIHRSHYRRSVVSRDVLGVVNILCKAQGDDKDPEDLSIPGTSASESLQELYGENTRNDHLNQIVDLNDVLSTSSIQSFPTHVPDINDNRQTIRKRYHLSSDYSSSSESSSPERFKPKKKNAKQTKKKFTKNDDEKKKKIRWTTEEKTAAFDAFGGLIRSNRLPLVKDLKKFLSDNPWILRTVNQVRTWASNEKKKNILVRPD